MMTKLVRCILGISVCAGLAQAETLERVISREDWNKLPSNYESQSDPHWDKTIAPNTPRVKK